jgi:hypothetical protein
MTSTVGERNSRAVPASEHVREAYAHTLTALLRLPHEVDEHGEWVSHMLLLTSDAHEDLVGLIERIEPLLAPGAALGHIPDWAGKLAGAVARIAGLLHCAAVVAETSANPWDSSIESSTMRGALLIGEYLLAHALEAFRQMGADERLRDAEIVLAWIKRNRRVTVTRREMFRGVTSSRFRHVADLEPAISELVERGYIRSRNPEPGKSGRPSQVFDVNPAVIEGGTAAGSVSFVSHSACL